MFFRKLEASRVEAACPMQPAGILKTPHPFGQYRMISLSHLLSIRTRSLLPLSQEQGSIDTETVAATRFAALQSSLFKPQTKNQLVDLTSLSNKSKIDPILGGISAAKDFHRQASAIAWQISRLPLA